MVYVPNQLQSDGLCEMLYFLYISIKLRNTHSNKDFTMVINDTRASDGPRWCGLMTVVKSLFECLWLYGNT